MKSGERYAGVFEKDSFVPPKPKEEEESNFGTEVRPKKKDTS